uniref:Uncharacterized protein n=1 Tax=Anopheles farauti TaxID=69004 RepID=A0A182QKA5_9DIPT
MLGDVDRSGVHDSDDEDKFFTPGTRSNGMSAIAVLFGIKPKGAAGASERNIAPVAPKSVKISDRYGPSNFRYIPTEPAEDEPIEDANDSAPEWSIMRASVVTAHKLVEGDSVFLGKIGMALLKSSLGHRLVLYRTKTDVLGTVSLSSGTTVFLNEGYVQFHADDSSDFWSVLFESKSDREAILGIIESICYIERGPVIEEPMSEVEKDPEPPKNNRLELAARMARMGGQAMPLPERSKAPPIPTNAPGSDSSDTSDSKIEKVSTRPIRRPNAVSTVGMQMVPLAGMMTGGIGAGPNPAASAIADVNFNLIMSENRMQNTEMRMNLTKLESKIDTVLDRISLLDVQGTSERPAIDKEAEVLELEEKLLELKRANHALKTHVRTLEATERDGKREAKLEEKLQILEESERRLKEHVASLERKLDTSRTESEHQNEKLNLLEKQLAEEKENAERNTKELQTVQEQLESAQRERNQLKEQLEKEIHRAEAIKKQLDQLQQEHHEQQAQGQRRPPALNASLVKDIMNGCYQQLCDQITDPAVLRIIAQTIKRETKAALERGGGQ